MNTTLMKRAAAALSGAVAAATLATTTYAIGRPTAIVTTKPPAPVRWPARHPATGITLYAGGATVPAIAYVGSAAETNTLVTSPATGSVFGAFIAKNPTVAISYCQTGSGFGKKVLDGLVLASNPCAPPGSPATGFQGANGYADFASADPYAGSEDQAFLADASNSANAIFDRGEPVQVPYVAGALALLYDNPDVTAQLRLTEKVLCEIADGEIADWNQVPVDPANPKGSKFPERPLKWAYRLDSSGSTFAFSNHLSDANGSVRKVCAGGGETFALNTTYDPANNTSGATTGVLPSPLPPGASSANFVGANGNSALAACIIGTAPCVAAGNVPATGGPGTIGYVEAANALADATGPSQNFALVHVMRNGAALDLSPIADLPAATKTIVATALKTDLVVASTVVNGRPNPDLVAPPIAPPVTGCLGVIDPLTYANPKRGYPIVAVAYFDASSANNGANAAPLQALAKFTSSTTNYGPGNITTVDAKTVSVGTTGYAQLGVSETAVSKLARCIGATPAPGN